MSNNHDSLKGFINYFHHHSNHLTRIKTEILIEFNSVNLLDKRCYAITCVKNSVVSTFTIFSRFQRCINQAMFYIFLSINKRDFIFTNKQKLLN